MKPEKPPREWSRASGSRLRTYRQSTSDEMVEQLKSLAPADATTDELLTEDSNVTVKRQLLKEGYNLCLKRIFELSLDEEVPTIAASGDFQHD